MLMIKTKLKKPHPLGELHRAYLMLKFWVGLTMNICIFKCVTVLQTRNFKSFSSPCGMCCVILQMTGLEVFTLMNIQLPLQIPGQKGKSWGSQPFCQSLRWQIQHLQWTTLGSSMQPRSSHGEWCEVAQLGVLPFSDTAGKKHSVFAPLQTKAKGSFLLLSFLIFTAPFSTPS